MSSLRWTPEQLEEFQRRQRQQAAAGQITVRTHLIELEPRRGPQKAAKKPSEIEELFAAQIAEAGLPAPQREAAYLIGHRHRLDFAWPALKIGVEVQGMVHRIKGRFEADIEKRALGLLQGWRVLEVSGAAIRDGRAIKWLRALLTL